MIDVNSPENTINAGFTFSAKKSKKSYVKTDRIIIFLTFLIVIFAFLVRTWRMIREGHPITFDGYYYSSFVKQGFFQGWIDITLITRDPPGLTFIILFATHLLGLEVEPLTWAIYIFPQIVCTIQLIIFYVLARRLTKTRTIGLLSMFYMSIMGAIVYRNQNIAAETIVLGLVPFVVFYLLRYYETKDYRFILLAILTTFTIAFIHHLTTLIVILIWHVSLLYITFYKNKIKDKNSIKNMLINLFILVFIDGIVLLIWFVVIKGYPINFIGDTISGLFTDEYFTWSNILLLLAILVMISIATSVLFYDFQNKKINNTIIITISVSIVVAFMMAMFYGGASPDQTLISALAMGTHAFVLAPLGVLGLTKIAKKTEINGKIIRVWVFSTIAVICVTAIFPLLSSLLARLVLYLIPVGVVLSVIAIVFIVRKINVRKFKAVALIALSGCMALTLSYSHPKPINNWGSQDMFWPAEFDTVYFLVDYGNPPNHTIWEKDYPVQIDSDFRLGVIVKGIGGFTSTVGSTNSSWLRLIIFLNGSALENFVTNSSVKAFNPNIDYLLLNEVLFESGFHTNFIAYGNEADDWIVIFPQIIKTIISLNPYINRIYDNNMATIFRPV